MYGTRNCNRKIAMRDKSNLLSNETDSCKNRIIPQKIPLTEVTKSLRPRRGCKENVGIKNCDENQIPDSNECITKPKLNKKFRKPLMSSKLESDQVLEKLPLKTEMKSTNLANPKKSILQSIQNLNAKKLDSTEIYKINSKILQKIPLTEETKTLRPRRGYTKTVDENNGNENQVPQRDASAKPKSIPKKSKFMMSRSKSIEISEEPANSGEISMDIEENNNKGALQSIHNLNLANNKAVLKVNSKSSRKRPLLCINQNEESMTKMAKINPLKATQETSLKNRFPKWVSNGLESFKRGKKSARVSQIYDLDKDEDLMLEKSMNKSVVVKKAKVTKIKKIATKRDFKVKNTKRHLDKVESKKATRKPTDNSCLKTSFLVKNTEAEMAKHNLFTSQKQVEDENDVTLHTSFNLDENNSGKFIAATCSTKPLQDANDVEKSSEVHEIRERQAKGAQIKFSQTNCGVKSSKNLQVFPIAQQSSTSENPWKILLNDLEKTFELRKTPEKLTKHTLVGSSQANSVVKSSKSLQPFPMPQQSSTPENVDRPIIAAQMLCKEFNVTMLEIQRIVPQEDQADFSDTEFLSPGKAASEAVTEKTESKKEKNLNKFSAIRNLSASFQEQSSNENLKNDYLEENNSMARVSNSSMVSTLSCDNNTVRKENVIKSKQRNPSKNPDQIRKNIMRPKRACHQNKPVIESSSSDLELSSESQLSDHEITLFESPQKKHTLVEQPQQYSPSKIVLKKLFPEEFDQSPVKVIEVEDQVKKPRLSYHSPAQFRGFVSKRKKENKVVEKAKTKEDKLIDSLNEHFSEFDNLELCIE